MWHGEHSSSHLALAVAGANVDGKGTGGRMRFLAAYVSVDKSITASNAVASTSTNLGSRKYKMVYQEAHVRAGLFTHILCWRLVEHGHGNCRL